jgi:PKD repeat protein
MTGDLISAPGRPNTMYVNFAAGNPLAYPAGWVDIETVSGSQWSMHIYPRITQTPPQAIISPTPSTVCTGESIVFDGTGSPNTVNWNWAINGTGTPYPTGSAPNVIMNTDGSHWVYMQAINSCGFDHIDSVQVTVNPTPSVGLSATATTICPGGNSDITASGATTYSWSPAGTLSGSTGATATAAPTTTTTYTVTGTTGGCSNYSDITIIIDDSNPDAAFIMDNDTICEGDAVNYNGAISDGGSNYTWTFVGGDISSSTDPNPSVVYSTQGTYSIDLTVENTCSQTDNITGSIVVLPASACVNGFSELTLQGVNAYYYNEGNLINVAFENSFDNVKLTLLNSLGQVSVKEQLLNVISGTTFEINTGSLSTGIYFLEVNNGVGNKVIKLSIQ